MISIDEVNKTILDLEQKDTSYATCERLAWLYIVKDHLTGQVQPITHEKSPEMTGSFFLELASGIDTYELMKIIDEHMNVIMLIIPKEYDAVMKKIEELKSGK